MRPLWEILAVRSNPDTIPRQNLDAMGNIGKIEGRKQKADDSHSAADRPNKMAWM